MDTNAALAAQDTLFADYNVHSLGHLIVPDFPARFSFQVDIVPSQCPEHLVFGLVAREPVNSAKAHTSGFVIRLELDTHEVWDHIQNHGVLGALEPEDGLDAFTEEEPLLLSWEIERTGQALLPRLHIGGQQFLYPAMHCPRPTLLEALVGCSGPWSGDMRELFMHPALWREQIAIPAPAAILGANWADVAAA